MCFYRRHVYRLNAAAGWRQAKFLTAAFFQQFVARRLYHGAIVAQRQALHDRIPPFCTVTDS